MGGAAQTGAGREQGPARTGAGQGRGMAWKTGRRRPLLHASRDGRLQNGLLAARNARIRRRTASGGRRRRRLQWISGGMDEYP